MEEQVNTKLERTSLSVYTSGGDTFRGNTR